jgi:AcrR family transcriptional regulator
MIKKGVRGRRVFLVKGQAVHPAPTRREMIRSHMSPRPYRSVQRYAAAEQTRARIITAARELLNASGGFSGFTVDAVARQAGVARLTVYYQFGSKLGLLEALFDDLAARGQIQDLAAAFQQPDPEVALSQFIEVLGRFWTSDRRVIRRLRALAALDPEVEQGLQERDQWRRGGLGVLVRRLSAERGRPAAEAVDDVVDLLFTLTSFESFDSLAGPERSPEAVTPLVQRLARAALGLDERGER